MSGTCKNASMAALSLVLSVLLWEEEMRAEPGCVRSSEREAARVEEAATESEREMAHLEPSAVRRDYGWRWCSPP